MENLFYVCILAHDAGHQIGFLLSQKEHCSLPMQELAKKLEDIIACKDQAMLTILTEVMERTNKSSFSNERKMITEIRKIIELLSCERYGTKPRVLIEKAKRFCTELSETIERHV